jgi:hypothetical protein
MTCAFGKVGEIRQVGGKEGMGASVVSGNNFRKNDVNTYVKVWAPKPQTLNPKQLSQGRRQYLCSGVGP